MSDTCSALKIDYKNLTIYRENGTEEINYPLVVSVPHAGHCFPPEFLTLTSLKPEQLRSNEDLFVDEIVSPLGANGIPSIYMNLSRAFIDVNRDKIELDAKMFYDYPQDKITIENNRCRFGLGLIHRIDADNNLIYKSFLSYNEIQDRIKYVYDVYHKRLSQLIGKCLKKFGFCVVLDCHSMPSKICTIIPDNPRIDFCIGDLFSQSCPPQYTDFLLQKLTKKGYMVTTNIPYSGAYTTFNYCQPRKKVYTLQLEINRGIYANEKDMTKNDNFQRVSLDTSASILDFANFLLDF